MKNIFCSNQQQSKFLQFVVFEVILLIIAYVFGITFVVFNEKNIVYNWPQYVSLCFFHIVLFEFMLISCGLYSSEILSRKYERNPRLLLVSLSSFFILVQMVYFFPSLDVGHFTWFIIYVASTFFLLLTRLLRFNSNRYVYLKQQVLILGAGKKALQLERHLEQKTSSVNIQGYVHVPGERELISKEKIIYSVKNLSRLVQEKQINTIVVAVDDRRNQFPLTQLLTVKFLGVEVLDILKFYEREYGYIKTDIMDPSFLIFSKGFHTIKLTRLLKRLTDIVCSLCILFITSPVFLLSIFFLWVNRHNNNAEIFNKRLMIGLNNHAYNQYEFNFHPSNHALRHFFKKKLIHLPKWWNVLQGNLSVVGPLPKDLTHYQQGIKNISYYQARTIVKPGLYSWYTIQAKDNVYLDANDNELVEFQYDIYYVKNQTLFLDLIVFMSLFSHKSSCRANKYKVGRLNILKN